MQIKRRCKATTINNFEAKVTVSRTSGLPLLSKYSQGSKSEKKMKIRAKTNSIKIVIKKIDIAIRFRFL